MKEKRILHVGGEVSFSPGLPRDSTTWEKGAGASIWGFDRGSSFGKIPGGLTFLGAIAFYFWITLCLQPDLYFSSWVVISWIALIIFMSRDYVLGEWGSGLFRWRKEFGLDSGRVFVGMPNGHLLSLKKVHGRLFKRQSGI